MWWDTFRIVYSFCTQSRTLGASESERVESEQLPRENTCGLVAIRTQFLKIQYFTTHFIAAFELRKCDRWKLH